MSPQQHLPHAFRILDTQVSPVLLNLFNYFVIVIFVPIFDRYVTFELACVIVIFVPIFDSYVTFELACADTTLLPTVRLVIDCLFGCLLLRSFFTHQNENWSVCCSLWGFVFDVILVSSIWILLAFCAQTWANKHLTIQGWYTPPSRTVGAVAVFRQSRKFVAVCSKNESMHACTARVAKRISLTVHTETPTICVSPTIPNALNMSINDLLSTHAIIQPWR